MIIPSLSKSNIDCREQFHSKENRYYVNTNPRGYNSILKIKEFIESVNFFVDKIRNYETPNKNQDSTNNKTYSAFDSALSVISNFRLDELCRLKVTLTNELLESEKYLISCQNLLHSKEFVNNEELIDYLKGCLYEIEGRKEEIIKKIERINKINYNFCSEKLAFINSIKIISEKKLGFDLTQKVKDNISDLEPSKKSNSNAIEELNLDIEQCLNELKIKSNEMIKTYKESLVNELEILINDLEQKVTDHINTNLLECDSEYAKNKMSEVFFDKLNALSDIDTECVKKFIKNIRTTKENRITLKESLSDSGNLSEENLENIGYITDNLSKLTTIEKDLIEKKRELEYNKNNLREIVEKVVDGEPWDRVFILCYFYSKLIT